MNVQSQSEVDAAQAGASEHFYSGALARIGRFMLVLAPACVAATWWRFGFRGAAGFGFGCVIAYVNFHWLKRVIAGFVDHATGGAPAQTGKGIVFRFLLRYALMAIGAYAILTVSPASLNGLLAGLFLPVAAISCEAAYEVYAALVRGV
jgi:ATP synthase I chain